jgi:predicted MPP superfamily phosphohydrolase
MSLDSDSKIKPEPKEKVEPKKKVELKPDKPKLTRRQFFVRSSLFTMTGLGVYAFGIEPRWIQIEKRELPIKRLPGHLDGKIAIQISDLHIGKRVGESWIRSQFEYINSLEPDFVFFTGDYVDNGTEWHVDLGCKMLEHFPRGKLGTACVLGNHDFGVSEFNANEHSSNTQKLIDRFQDAGLNLLRDEVVGLSGLKVAGLRDLWFGGFDLGSAREAISDLIDEPGIILSHNPDSVDLPIWQYYDSWVLCGHTHGGQCRFPLIGAPIVPVANKRYVAGKYDIEGGHQMYISRGVGHTRRVRFMSRPEITVFTLRSAPAQP